MLSFYVVEETLNTVMSCKWVYESSLLAVVMVIDVPCTLIMGLIYLTVILCCLMEGGFMGFMGGKTLCCAGTLAMDQMFLDIILLILVV